MARPCIDLSADDVFDLVSSDDEVQAASTMADGSGSGKRLVAGGAGDDRSSSTSSSADDHVGGNGDPGNDSGSDFSHGNDPKRQRTNPTSHHATATQQLWFDLSNVTPP